MSINVVTEVHCDIKDCLSWVSGPVHHLAQSRQARAYGRELGWRHLRGWDLCPNHPDLTNLNLKDRHRTQGETP